MKKNNKGFSLVELIIVIAIMAILAGAIAPALIKYIDKSRKSNDVSSAKTIKTAIETALGNESVYELLTTGDGDFCYIYITPGEGLATSDNDGKATTNIKLDGQSDKDINGKSNSALVELAQNTIGSNIGEKAPKLKYKKDPSGKKDSSSVPTEFVGVVSKAGTVYVFISVTTAEGMEVSESSGNVIAGSAESPTGYQICPNICDEYQ